MRCRNSPPSSIASTGSSVPSIVLPTIPILAVPPTPTAPSKSKSRPATTRSATARPISPLRNELRGIVQANLYVMAGISAGDLRHCGTLQFEIQARQHVIISDQPAENGGFDEVMTPPEMLLASLGSCAGFYAAQYLRNHKLATEGTVVRVAADKAKGPARLDNFRIALEIPRDLNQQDLDGVHRAVHDCLIHNTLLNPPKIAISVRATQIIAK